MIDFWCLGLRAIGNHGLYNMNGLEMGNIVKKELSKFSFVNWNQLKELELLYNNIELGDANANVIFREKIFNVSFDKLDNKIKLDSKDFLDSQKHINQQTEIKNIMVDTINEIKENEWNYYIDGDGITVNNWYLNFYIEFSTISFVHHRITYKDWLHTHRIIRDEWRKYFYQIIKLFGGNKAIYIPEYIYYADGFGLNDGPIAFNEIENILIKIFGRNNKRLQDISKDEYYGYIVDDFSDINLDKNMDINDFKKYLKNINII
jgi:hypothetical protein